jgi:predicted transcriptional regulator YdeE
MQEKSANEQTIQAEPVRVLKLEEMKVVGFAINVSFQDGDFSKIGKTKQLFIDRLNEIKHAVDTETYWAPWYSCENMFTYFYCLQVNELSDIPDGMMGFTIPTATYAVVYYDGPHPMNPDPYGTLAAYRRENGLVHAEKKMNLEKYRFDRECIPQEKVTVEVYGPIKQN